MAGAGASAAGRGCRGGEALLHARCSCRYRSCGSEARTVEVREILCGRTNRVQSLLAEWLDLSGVPGAMQRRPARSQAAWLAA